MARKSLERSPFAVSRFLVLVNSGSRHEARYPSGISHFLEKLAFSVSIYVYYTAFLKIKHDDRPHQLLLMFCLHALFSLHHNMGVKTKFSCHWKNMVESVTAKHPGLSFNFISHLMIPFYSQVLDM